MKRILFFVLATLALFASPAIALFIGIVFALLLGTIFSKQTSFLSSLLLKIAVVGLGFGINLNTAISASQQGFIFTLISVFLVMIVGVFLSRWFKIDAKLGYLVSSGTAICGGSAIAAIAPAIKADCNQTSMSLAVIFTLNAIAMLIFPYIGHLFNLSQSEFGTWAAIAIHDTSAVVGAAKMYGNEALQIATTVKLCRALWIIPLSIVSIILFRNNEGKKKIAIPWFILLFVIAMVVNSYFPLNEKCLQMVSEVSHKLLNVTLFLIGTKLSLEAIRSAGYKPIILGVALWTIISTFTMLVILFL